MEKPWSDEVILNENQKRKIDKINTTTDKSNCLTEAIGRGGSSNEYLTMVKKKTLVLNELVRGALRGRKINPETGKRDDNNPDAPYKKFVETRRDGKSNCMTTVHNVSLVVDKESFKYRKLSCIEAERLQTLQDGYTAGESNSQRYKMIGNGFTVEIIRVFFDALKVELDRRKATI